MAELPTRDAFAQCLGQPFRVHVGSTDSVEMELIEVTALRPGSAGGDRPFSLVFRGRRSPVLPQQMYPMENDRLGWHEIFIVPIGADPEGIRYEAVFN